MADKFKNIQDLIDQHRDGLIPLIEAEKDLLIEYNELEKEALESGDKKKKRLEDILLKKEEELALAHQLADMGLKLEGHYDTIYAAEEAKLKLARQNVLEMERGEPLLEKAYQLALKINTEEQNALKARKEAAGYTENLITRMTGISDKPKSGISKMFSNPEGFAKGFGDGIGKMLTPMNIMTSSIDKVVETTMALAIEQDAAISNFRKATGATGAFDDDIVKLEKDLRMAGVTSAEAAESVQELYVNVSGFTEMGSEAREEMAGMVAVLSEVGVAAADSTKNIQIAIKGLGMANSEATALQSELRSFAQGINVSTGQLAKDFATMGPQIAAMGDKGVDAFKNLQVTMKETGLEMSTMLKLVEQFDTFDGAGQQVGKLNALLGGPFLNTLDLVSETDLGARMEKLRDGVMAAGLSFDDMDYYQKKAYTSALGLNSEMELAMFLTALVAGLFTLRAVLHLNTWATAAYTAAKKADNAATIGGIVWDKIKLALMNAKAAALTWLTGASAAKTASTVTEAAAEAALSTQHVLTAGSLGTYVAAVPPAIIANKTLAGSSVAAGTAMAGAVLPMLAFGGAILMVGLGIGIAAAGMALLVNSIAGLAGLHGDIFKTAFAILAVAAALGDIPLTKTVAVAAVIMPLAAMAPVAMMAAAGAGAMSRGLGGGAGSAGAGASVKPPDVHVTVKIGDKEFNELVNSVEVGNKVTSKLHQTFVDQVSAALLAKA